MTDTAHETHEVDLVVNGAAHRIDVPARKLLSDAIRQDCGLTGTHVGCEHGVCGACTVLVDGTPARSCLMLAVSADGRDVTTVEGLTEPGDRLSPVQQAFKECHGLQCGYCTPGMVMSAIDLCTHHPKSSETEVRALLDGNMCRCTGYQNIVKAVMMGGEAMASGQPIKTAETA
ncbi:MAG: (2Fe-2S)-binding protein [Nocardioidaceae bacterium]|nr:(2Fe-2S)-binding protein [Nocardioidaceae bacterium]